MNRAFSVLVLILLFSCTLKDIQHSPGLTMLEGVPVFEQEDFQCGPAALAAVINYWYGKEGAGKYLSPEDIVSDIYSPSARGILGMDLELYAKKRGFYASQFSGSLGEIKGYIDKGIPLIILVDYGFSVVQRNHFLVTVGYAKNSILVNSGRKRRELIRNDELERIWGKSRFWALAIKP